MEKNQLTGLACDQRQLDQAFIDTMSLNMRKTFTERAFMDRLFEFRDGYKNFQFHEVAYIDSAFSIH